MSKQKPVSEETLKTIEKIAKSLSYKFKFDCYDQDDAYQEAMYRGLKALSTYDETKGPVENYLRKCMRTRMINYKRDMNRAGKNLPKENVKTEAYEMLFDETEVEFYKNNLDPENRIHFIKLTSGAKLTQVQKESLYEAIKNLQELE